ncbi:hypothetical protein HOP52_11885 [Halomonas campisalis]|uniref:Uncharacterized protein n=1 Tax=Billgrantia campisalis TaxID=74661 RepID=A0ABS9P9L9_9GAMM|nr:hypothetical protein [Halomonas campisalis]MCG6658453.1 hypothetical protein [Halomonas campisalis]MDR5863313.1 hypothetical protein [Halomonas campisalis]
MTLPEAEMALRLRELLEGLPDEAVPITYQQAAEALGLTPPRTIQRVALALEALMREDAAAGRPLIAALVVSRRGDLPRQGFFDLAVELGRLPADPAHHAAAYRAELTRVMEERA